MINIKFGKKITLILCALFLIHTVSLIFVSGSSGNDNVELVSDPNFTSTSLAASPWDTIKWADFGSIDAEDLAQINDLDNQLVFQIHDDDGLGEDMAEFVRVYQRLLKKYTLPSQTQQFDIEIGYTLLVTGGSGFLAEDTVIAFELALGPYTTTIISYYNSATNQAFWSSGYLVYSEQIVISQTDAASNNYETDWMLDLDLHSSSICYDQYTRLFIDYVTVEIDDCFDSPYDYPETPTLDSPSNGALITDTTPLLDWSYSDTDAIDFEVEIDGISDTTSSSSEEYLAPTLSQGSHSWRVRAYDGYNWGAWSTTWSFTVDSIPPNSPALVSPSSGALISDNTPYLDWNSVSTAVEYWVQVDDSSGFTSPAAEDHTTSTYYNCPTLSDDFYYWHVTARDAAGNWAFWSISWTFTVDTIAPSPAPVLVSPSNGFLTDDNTPYLDWNSVSTAVEYRVEIDGNSYYTSSTAYTAPTLSEGSHSWRVCARDAAGNWGAWSSPWTFTVDTIPPSPAPVLVSPSNGALTTDNTPYLDWNSVSTAVEYRVEIDGNSYYTSSTEYTAPTLSEGSHSWRVCARDAAGNWGAWSTTWSFTVDTTAPSPAPVLVSPSNGALTTDNTPLLDWNSVATAVEYRVEIDGNSYYTSSTEYTAPTLSEGSHSWRVCARDAAGNWGAWSSPWTFTVDTIGPSPAPVLVSPSNGALINDNTPYLDWNSVSTAVEYRVEIDGNSYYTSSTEYTAPTLSEGSHSWRVCARDAAGNWGAWSSPWTFTVDTIAPSISSINHTPANPSDVDSVTIGAIITDASGIQSVTLHYRVNGGSWQSVSMSLISGTTYEATLGPFNFDDVIDYYVEAYDVAVSSNIAVNDNGGSYYSFTVGPSDVTGPTISNVEHIPNNPTDIDSVTISATVSDASSIQSVTLYYRINGGSWQTVAMTVSSGDTYQVIIGSFNVADFIEYYIVAIDDSPNHNQATADNGGSYYSFTVTSVPDTTPPTITAISHNPVAPTDTDSVTISVTVSDASGIQSVTLYYRVNDGSWQTVAMTISSGDTYQTIIGSFNVADLIEYYIVAVDNSPNHNQATADNGGSYYSFTVTSVPDTTPPTITTISHNPVAPTDADSVTISATVTDAYNIQSVTLYYRVNGGSWQTVAMTISSGDTYQTIIGSFNVTDLIEYFIVAVDDSPNHNQATADNGGSYYSFTVTDSSIPDTTPPIITTISHNPVAPTDTDSVTISATVTDDLSGIQVTLYYRINGGSWQTSTMTISSGDTYQVIIGSFNVADFIEYYIVAIDDSPNHNQATADNGGSYYSFTVSSIPDTTPPTITAISHNPVAPTDVDSVTVSAVVIDASGIQSVTLYYRINAGSWQTLTMSLSSGDTYQTIIGSFNVDDVIEYYIVAIDASTNYNQATADNGGSYYSFTVTSVPDTTPPTITAISHSPVAPTDSDSVTISAVVIDVSGIQSVTLYYRINGGNWQSTTMSLSSSDTYQAIIGPFVEGSVLEYYIVAIDASPNHNQATADNSGSYYSFTVTSTTIIDTTPPIISNVQHTPDNPDYTETITISATVTDDLSGIQSVTLYYRINGGNWQSTVMSLSSGNTYQAIIGPFVEGSVLEYYIIATDDSTNNNKATADNAGYNYSFTVTNTTRTASYLNFLMIALILFAVTLIRQLQRKPRKNI